LPPEEVPVARVEGVGVTVVRAHEEPVSGQRDGALDPALCVIRPADPTGLHVERVHVAAPVADVYAPVRNERRRLAWTNARPPKDATESRRVGDDLAVGLLRCVAGGPVQEGRVDDVRVNGGRRGGAPVLEVLPCTLARLRVHGDRDTGVVREVEPPVRDHGRKLKQRLRAIPPQRPKRWPQPDVGDEARATRRVAVRRPEHPFLTDARGNRLGRDELDGR